MSATPPPTNKLMNHDTKIPKKIYKNGWIYYWSVSWLVLSLHPKETEYKRGGERCSHERVELKQRTWPKELDPNAELCSIQTPFRKLQGNLIWRKSFQDTKAFKVLHRSDLIGVVGYNVTVLLDICCPADATILAGRKFEISIIQLIAWSLISNTYFVFVGIDLGTL